MKWLLCLLPLTSGCVVEDLIELPGNIAEIEAVLADLTALFDALMAAGGVC